MKTYKYSTKERAERVAKTLGCTGSHYHNEDGERKYMPCKDMKTFKEATKKQSKGKEEEVTELVDDDSTWLSSSIPIMDPASSLKGSSTTDRTVGMARMPRDPLLRGWYGYYGENEIKEEDMSDAFGFDDTMFMNYKQTVKHYQKKLGLDKDDAIDRTVQQGKKPNLIKRAPKKLKKKKHFIDRLILKEKEIDESEEVREDKLIDKKDTSVAGSIIKRNVMSLKNMASKHGITVDQLIRLLKNEQ
jgi:hypothetical protein